MWSDCQLEIARVTFFLRAIVPAIYLQPLLPPGVLLRQFFEAAFSAPLARARAVLMPLRCGVCVLVLACACALSMLVPCSSSVPLYVGACPPAPAIVVPPRRGGVLLPRHEGAQPLLHDDAAPLSAGVLLPPVFAFPPTASVVLFAPNA